MRKKPQKYLVDIQLSIDHILHFHLGEIDGLEDFTQNITAIRAVEREFLIIGEAVKKLKDFGIELSHSGWLINYRNTMAHQ